MEDKKKDEIIAAEQNDVLDIEDGPSLVTLKKGITYENVTYHKIDLTGLENIDAKDMMTVSRQMSRNGNVDFLQEYSLEYALNLAQIATGIPFEFFEQLPPYAALKVKRCVTNFLFG